MENFSDAQRSDDGEEQLFLELGASTISFPLQSQSMRTATRIKLSNAHRHRGAVNKNSGRLPSLGGAVVPGAGQ